MNTTHFIIIPEDIDTKQLILLASQPCEKYTGTTICPDNPGLTPNAQYTAERYCDPCRLRTAVKHITIKPAKQPTHS